MEKERLFKILKQAGTIDFLKEDEVTTADILTEGMTNTNYLCITLTGQKYVVRVPGENTSDIINRENEWYNHFKIEKLHLNPDHKAYIQNCWIKISCFIENKFNTISSREKQIDLLCKTIKILHNSKVVFKNRFWAGEMIDLYEAIANKKQIVLHREYMMLRKSLKEKYEDYLYSKMNWTACHNDLMKENFMWDGKKIYLIDWEYSGMNDPLWDLAALVIEYNLNSDEEQYLFQQYQRQPLTNEILKKIALLKIYVDVFWYVWAKIREPDNCNFDYAQYADMRLERAISNYSSFKKEKD